MLGVGYIFVIVNGLWPQLCNSTPDRLIENKGLSQEFGDSLAVGDKNRPLVPFTESLRTRCSQLTEKASIQQWAPSGARRTQKPDRLTVDNRKRAHADAEHTENRNGDGSAARPVSKCR